MRREAKNAKKEEEFRHQLALAKYEKKVEMAQS
jgi:hypothetical protein